MTHIVLIIETYYKSYLSLLFFLVYLEASVQNSTVLTLILVLASKFVLVSNDSARQSITVNAKR